MSLGPFCSVNILEGVAMMFLPAMFGVEHLVFAKNHVPAGHRDGLGSDAPIGEFV